MPPRKRAASRRISRFREKIKSLSGYTPIKYAKMPSLSGYIPIKQTKYGVCRGIFRQNTNPPRGKPAARERYTGGSVHRPARIIEILFYRVFIVAAAMIVYRAVACDLFSASRNALFVYIFVIIAAYGTLYLSPIHFPLPARKDARGGSYLLNIVPMYCMIAFTFFLFLPQSTNCKG